MNSPKDYTSFEQVQSRLNEIVEAVSDDALPLDAALLLYEEAASLGLRASDLLEHNIEAYDTIREADQADDADQADFANREADAAGHADAADRETGDEAAHSAPLSGEGDEPEAATQTAAQ